MKYLAFQASFLPLNTNVFWKGYRNDHSMDFRSGKESGTMQTLSANMPVPERKVTGGLYC